MTTSFEVGKIYLLKSGYIHRDNTPVKIIKKSAKMLSFEFLDKYTMSGIETLRVVKVSYKTYEAVSFTKETAYGSLSSIDLVN